MEQLFQTSLLDEYIQDESDIRGNAMGIAFPQNITGLKHVMEEADEMSAITVQGSGTGICGGAVPVHGYIVNLSQMCHIQSFRFEKERKTGVLTVEAGVTLEQIRELLRGKEKEPVFSDQESIEHWRSYLESGIRLEFLPNPSEASASIGGVLATNAMGSHVEIKEEIKEEVNAVRGFDRRGNELTQPSFLCGLEGTMGVLGEATLILREKPKCKSGVFLFFRKLKEMFQCYEEMKKISESYAGITLRCGEYFHRCCLTYLQDYGQRPQTITSQIVFPSGADIGLWIEVGAQEEEELLEGLEKLLLHLEEGDFSEQGLVAMEEREFEQLDSLGHLLTEEINMDLHRASSLQVDIQGKEVDFVTMAGYINASIEGKNIGGVIRGHLGSNQMSIRIFPRDEQQMEALHSLKVTWSFFFKQEGIVCSREYGIGRKKVPDFLEWSLEEGKKIQEQQAQLGEHNRYNPEVLVPVGVAL